MGSGYCFILVHYLFPFLKLLLYTQSLVPVLYSVRRMPIVTERDRHEQIFSDILNINFFS